MRDFLNRRGVDLKRTLKARDLISLPLRVILHFGVQARALGVLGIRIFLHLILFTSMTNSSAGSIFIDEIGEEVRIEGVPHRIVSLAPSITEIIFAIGAGNKLVGVTDFCDYPEEARRKERIGGFINPNIEKILSLKPDLVFATKDGNDPSVVRRLKKMGIPVYVANQRNFTGLLNSILKISELLELAEEGRRVVDGIKAKEDGIKHKVKTKKRVLFLYGTEPMIAAGPATLADNLLRIAGGINVLADSPISYPKVNLESAISKKPDVIIVTTMGRGEAQDLKRLKEVFGNKVKEINGDIVNRPGPRIVDGLEELYRIIHGGEGSGE